MIIINDALTFLFVLNTVIHSTINSNSVVISEAVYDPVVAGKREIIMGTLYPGR